MSKSICQFLPVYEAKERRIQADIGISLFERADRIRKSRRLTWAEVMNALLEKFVDDLETKLTPREVPVFTNHLECDHRDLEQQQTLWD